MSGIGRFEQSKNLRVLRYMRADSAATMNCVNCHNAPEATLELFARRDVPDQGSRRQQCDALESEPTPQKK
ncbi:hypothetical protein [Noviherbaspirillum sp.]|uniref:hypothetical protein n=1 Tax=Noviherbaspirillum sp. TaxID=1926288 RepID=UPI003FA5512D